MTKIPPSERFNQHVKKVDISPAILEKFILSCGENPQSSKTEKLSGGFQNLNYHVKGKSNLVFRFYSLGNATAKKEYGILKFLEANRVRAPKPHSLIEIEDRCCLVMSFSEGEQLQERLLRGPNPEPDLFFDIGVQLGTIHNLQLPRTGFIGNGMSIGREYDNFGEFIRGYVLQSLQNLSEERLDRATANNLRQIVQLNWHLVTETEPACHLVHCDFNPKNILVSSNVSSNGAERPDNKVTSILDWEFGLSGNGYIDLGNFFRFFGDYPASAEEYFLEGYKSVRGPLNPNWKKIAKLLDLGNMCSFLETKENYEKTFRTARAVIAETLAYF